MAVNAIQLSRISNNLRSEFLLSSLRRNSAELLYQQNRVSLGRSFVTPSDDPVAASQSAYLNEIVARQEQILANAQHADSFLQATDAALLEVNDLLVQASSIASQSLAALASPEEREANGDLVSSIVDQLVAIGNRRFQGRYLFGGRNTTEAPFASALGGVAFTGDTGELLTRVSDKDFDAFNVPGDEVFGAISSEIQGQVELNPRISADTRLEDLGGAAGRGVTPGVLVFQAQAGASFEVELAGADTLGDVIDAINNAATQSGSGVSASLGDFGIDINAGATSVTITDSSGGLVATDLGLLIETATSGTISGLPLAPRLTPATPIASLNGGAGLDLSGSILITNGQESREVDLSGAQTVQDILNALNSQGMYIEARINEAGTGIDVLNRVSGVRLSIGENNGTTATQLGIRTLTTATPLDEVFISEDALSEAGESDFLVTAKNGDAFEVDLSGLTTVGEVIDAINTAAQAAGVNVTASLVDVGNGLVLEDGTAGSGTLSVTSVNQSFAAEDLGLAKSVVDPATELVGDDPSGVTVDSIFTALLDLASALRADDDSAITDAGDRLTQFTDDITRARGLVGARSAAMQRRVDHADESVFDATERAATIATLDFAEGITQFQHSQATYQASLLVGSRINGLSLLDYLA